MKPVSEKLLSPKLLSETDPSYESVKELTEAVALDSCKNIAVTGIYGAGKSSVINTFVSSYEKNNPDKRILRISLSTFDIPSDSQPNENSYENDVEYKLVQQILYRSNPDELYQSSFKRIIYRSLDSIIDLTWYIILSIIAIVFLFEPEFLRIDSINSFFVSLVGVEDAGKIALVMDIFSLGWLIYVSFLIVRWGLIRFSTISALRLKAKGAEVELSKDSSVFSKMLEEIYYFFRAGKYDLVVIEDLDRLKNPEGLFLKIRELNIMLNESHAFRSSKKIVRFIYAVRDDLFDSDLRVKFFDYIIPVVPIVNSYNAADYIIEKRSDIFEGKEELRRDIPEIAFYIREMRVLKNVLNEFDCYEKAIFNGQAHLSDSKMFAMIVYKNLWPENYSKLHSRSSILNHLFDDPSEFVNKLFATKVAQQSSLEKEINTMEGEAKAYRETCINLVRRTIPIRRLMIKDSSYSLDDLIEYDYLFSWFQQDKFDKYSVIDRSSRQELVRDLDFTFADMIARAGVDRASLAKLKNLREGLQGRYAEKNVIDKELAHKRASSFKEILMDADGDLALACIKERIGGLEGDLYEFILSMLRKGYIAEDYHSYISFYYEGTVSNRDRCFINAVMQGRSLDFDYQLDNPKEVRQQLKKEDNYSGNSILNYAFIQYLVQSKDDILNSVVNVARKNWSFIRSCDLVSDRMTSFLELHVFNSWYSCLEKLFSEKKDLAENLKVFFHYCPKEAVLYAGIKDSLASMYDVIAGVVSDERKVVTWLKSNGVVFHTMCSPQTEEEGKFLQAIITAGLFDITYENMLVILGEPYNVASYSEICKYGIDSFKDYLEKNIEETIKTFPETSVNETEWPLKSLLNNAKVDLDWKKSYLEKQVMPLNDFEGVLNEYVESVVAAGKVRATWENVYFALDKCEKHVIAAFVKEHKVELHGQECNMSEEKTLAIEKALFANNESLTIDEYGYLVELFSFPLAADVLNGLEEDRMELLVQKDLVKFGDDSLELLSSYRTEVIATHVVNHFEGFKDLAEGYNELYNNEFGVVVLRSSLSDEQKGYYLSRIAPSEMVSDSFYREYCKLICECVNRIGITAETDIELVTNAIVGYSEENDWFVKIDLVNKINAFSGYDKDLEIKLLNGLGGGYVELNSYYGSLVLDDKPQNRELLDFLVKNGHYVNKYYLREVGRLKVTFKREPGR